MRGCVSDSEDLYNDWIESSENIALVTAQGARKLDPMTPQQASTFFHTESDKFVGIAKTLNLVAQ